MNIVKGGHILNNNMILYLVFCAIGSENALINILLWNQVPVFEEKPGSQYFVSQNCSFQNCFLTDNRLFFKDILHFDVILFYSLQIYIRDPMSMVPSTRSAKQVYVFMSNEPASMYPITSFFNGFFNYTFTYKLDSDIPWRFFVVRNTANNKVVAPKVDVKWIDINDMEPVSEDIKRKLQNKNQAAAWLVSHCYTISKREDLIKKLKTELEKYNLSLEIKGRCIDPDAPPCNYWNEGCHRWIGEHYFYLAFENSLSEDYVTEKILTATKNFVVPIVFGGANYSRFLPKGSYIYANDLEPKELASKMNYIIQDKTKYYEYFKWHRYYSIHDHTESADADGVCALCAFLNNKIYEYKGNVYTHLTWFWRY